jgi:hypothetical protein
MSTLASQAGYGWTAAPDWKPYPAELMDAHDVMDRIFKRPFLWPGLYRRTGKDVNSRFCLMRNPLSYRSVRPESGREERGRFLVFRSFEIDRLDEPAHAAGRGSAGPDGLGSSKRRRSSGSVRCRCRVLEREGSSTSRMRVSRSRLGGSTTTRCGPTARSGTALQRSTPRGWTSSRMIGRTRGQVSRTGAVLRPVLGALTIAGPMKHAPIRRT